MTNTNSAAIVRLGIGASAIGFAAIFVKAIAMQPTEIAFYRTLIGSFFLLSFAIVTGKLCFRSFNKKVWFYVALGGVAFALDLIVWHRSIIYTGAGMATILANTQVFYVALIGIVFFKEKISPLFFFAILIAFLGITLLVGFQEGVKDSQNFTWGVFFGLLTAVFYSLYIFSLSKLEKLLPETHITVKLGLVLFVCAITSLTFAYGENALTLPNTENLLLLIGLALTVQVLGWYLISSSLAHVQISLVGLMILLQPTVATIMGVILFREHLNLWQIIGVALAMTGIYLGLTRRKA